MSKRLNYGFVKSENRPAYEKIMSLVDETGRPAILPAHMKIVETVASYSKATGCFASLSWINEQTLRARSKKTLPRHLDYLVQMGILSSCVENGRRVLRLREPPCNSICSQREYRTRKGLPEYSYRSSKMKEKKEQDDLTSWVFDGDNEPKKDDLFCSNLGVKFTPGGGEIRPPEGIISPTVLCNTMNDTKILPPIVPPPSPPEQGEQGSASRTQGGVARCASPLADDLRRRNPSEFFEEGKEELGDPIVLPRTKRPKNQRERQAASQAKINQGHIANPLGGPDNRPHRCNPKLARDISLDRAVTVPQLYRHVCKIFERAFGPGVFEGMMPSDRQAIGSMFGELKQRFIDCCNGFDPSYRDLAEYFEWFMEPKRLARMLSASKYTQGNKPIIHFRQVLGAAYIRNFYDEVIKHRLVSQAPRRNDSLGEMAEFWESVFQEFRTVQGSNWKFCRTMAAFGYAATAQFLADEYGYDESACRQKIISEMTQFISSSKERDKAVEYLSLAEKASEHCSKHLDDKCIWYDWKDRTGDLLKVACEKAGVSDGQNGQKIP